jgi:hypothetical protein
MYKRQPPVCAKASPPSYMLRHEFVTLPGTYIQCRICYYLVVRLFGTAETFWLPISLLKVG